MTLQDLYDTYPVFHIHEYDNFKHSMALLSDQKLLDILFDTHVWGMMNPTGIGGHRVKMMRDCALVQLDFRVSRGKLDEDQLQDVKDKAEFQIRLLS